MFLISAIYPNNSHRKLLSSIIVSSFFAAFGCAEIQSFENSEANSFEKEVIASRANLIALGFSRAKVIEVLGDQDSDIVDSGGLTVCDAFKYDFAGKQKFLSVFYDSNGRVVERQVGYDLACLIF